MDNNSIFATLILIICFILYPFVSQPQNKKKDREIKFYDGSFFTLEGNTFTYAVKESSYHRLPEEYKGKVREIVWDLSKCPAGMSIRFFTNSTSIHVKWSVQNSTIANRNHMADTGVKGIDLYFKKDKHWQYVNTARPNGKTFEELLVENMDRRKREFCLYLPLYIELVEIQIGIDPDCSIEKAPDTSAKPIVFYGTSITQGGCASRPGMAHTNIISRKLDIECVNFGFRGNGKMELEVVNILKEIDAKFYLIECLPNMTTEQVIERTRPLVEIIRKRHEDIPIVFVENLIYERSCLDSNIEKIINEKNLALKKEYEKMKKEGFKAIFYISGENALGKDHEATVDGTHLTDLGFLRYADFLIQNFRNYKLL